MGEAGEAPAPDFSVTSTHLPKTAGPLQGWGDRSLSGETVTEWGDRSLSGETGH